MGESLQRTRVDVLDPIDRARDRGSVTDPGLVPIELDITDAASVRAAAARSTAITLLINHAGISLRK